MWYTYNIIFLSACVSMLIHVYIFFNLSPPWVENIRTYTQPNKFYWLRVRVNVLYFPCFVTFSFTNRLILRSTYLISSGYIVWYCKDINYIGVVTLSDNGIAILLLFNVNMFFKSLCETPHQPPSQNAERIKREIRAVMKKYNSKVASIWYVWCEIGYYQLECSMWWR